MNRTVKAFIRVGYWVALGILVVNALLVHDGLRTIERNNARVDGTRQALLGLERILSLLKDAETGQRGYLLTGRDVYLDRYRIARAGLSGALEALPSLGLNRGDERPQVDELRRDVAAKLDELERTIERRRESGLEAAQAILNTDEGKRLMDRARAEVSLLESEESRVLGERTQASREAIQDAFVSIGVATTLGVVLMALAAAFDRRASVLKLRSREAIEAEQARLATTLASIGDAVIATDVEGRVIFMNPLAEHLTGWTRAEAGARPLHEVFRIINEQTRRPVDHPVETVLREGAVVGLANHKVLISKTGVETAIEDSAAPIRDGRGRLLGVVLVFHDDTDRRRNEAELRASKEEAEDANRAKDRFLAVLSHELRTPLNPILLAVSSMLERQVAPEEVRANLAMIRQNVNLQARLIDDLLDVMRIVRGKMPLHWEVVDAHVLIDQAVQICRSEVFGGGLTLEFDLAAGHHHLNADPARLQQLLWNLVKNSLKFTPGGGTVTIRTRNEPGDSPEPRLVLEVVDTGIGIEPAVLPTIFDPFQQGETGVTRRYGGLGLGLAICKGIVEGHGGTLSAESAGRGRGATFRVELQALPTAAIEGGNGLANSPGEEAEDAKPAPLRVLAVEDEPATRTLMARLLRGLGHEVTSAGNVAEALAAVGAIEFDMIVSDIGLPDGSGLDLMRAVVASRGPVPSIALTGYGMEEDIRRSREAGFTAHMTKPIDFTKLTGLIHHIALGKVPKDAFARPPQARH